MTAVCRNVQMNVAQVATQLSSSVEQDRRAFWEYPCDADSGGEEKNEEGGKWCNSNREKNYYDPANEIMRLFKASRTETLLRRQKNRSMADVSGELLLVSLAGGCCV
ncbi:hypothetical protein ANANG_G00307030 [Anguilla anguilla]|uniref:Uncharacterized protein n=1 Tax=Anguilla anguilla TaxID=7936 RepID=A0A9D3LMK2_ANGAN|nr:hypothetical protein ANANG_G00307030 [Anguilla anguilla]